MTKKKEALQVLLSFVCAAAIIAGVFMYWSRYKVIWFCDEIYSYFTANSAYAVGSRIEYGKWYDSQFVVDDMSPECGRYFFRTQHNVRSDDHPPIYFLTMHMASLIAGKSISKWVGLSINLICVMGISLFAFLLFYFISRKKIFAMLAVTALGMLPSMLTNAMLIRMYCMMTAWALFYVFISYVLYTRERDFIVRHKLLAGALYLVLSFITAFGFLTQYYFAVFAAAFTFCYGIYCIIKRYWDKLCCFAASMVISVGIATLIWPDWITQLFYRYCGEEVFSQAADFSGIFSEIIYGLTCMPKLMFYRFYIIGMVLIVAGIAFLIYKKDAFLPLVLMLLGSSVIYCLIVAHVTPSYYLDARYFYMATAVGYVGVLLQFVRCADYISKESVKNAVTYGVPMLLIIMNVLISQFDEMSMGYVDKSGQYNAKREQLSGYSDMPWVVYGYENWSFMETYYDLALGSRFIVYSDTDTFDEDECPADGEDFLFFLNNTFLSNEEILERLNNIYGCDHEIEYLFSKGSEVYLVRHIK
jgi:hypothetical protein